MIRGLRQVFSALAGLFLLVSTVSCVSFSAQDRELASLFVLGYKTHDMNRIRKDVGNNLGGIIWFRPNTKSRIQVRQDIAVLKAINPRLLMMANQEGGRVQRFNRYMICICVPCRATVCRKELSAQLMQGIIC